MRFAHRVLPLVALALLLASCGNKKPEVTQYSDEHASTLSLEERVTELGEVAFVIRNGDDVVRDFGVVHTKSMHLVIVREDLQYFSHLHPEMNADGVWRVAYAPPAGGVYWMYADFVDTGRGAYTIKFTKVYPGMPGPTEFSRDTGTVRTVDGYRFELVTSGTANETIFAYQITDTDGKPIVPEEYLGARGHSILLSLAGDFVHTHPTEGKQQPIFVVSEIVPGNYYRIFTQFKIDGEVKLVTFDWET